MASTKTIMDHGPLLPIDIGESTPDADPLIPADSEAGKALRDLIVTEDVPPGPYPFKSKTAGWLLAFFEDEETKPYYKKAGASNLDIDFPKDGKVKLVLQQEIYDPDRKEVFKNPQKWEHEATREKAYSILANEKKNWALYKKSLSEYVNKKEKFAAAGTLVKVLNAGYGRTLRSSPAKSTKGKSLNVGTKSTRETRVKRKIFDDSTNPVETVPKKKTKTVPKPARCQ